MRKTEKRKEKAADHNKVNRATALQNSERKSESGRERESTQARARVRAKTRAKKNARRKERARERAKERKARIPQQIQLGQCVAIQ